MIKNTLHRRALALAKKLISINTVNPPGNEYWCAYLLGSLLKRAGFAVQYHELAEGRTNVIAALKGGGPGAPLCFCGHLDTVPLGTAPWKRDPFKGIVSRGKLWGRGASDMKSGLAAMIASSLELARIERRKAGLLLVLTADEEKSCNGSVYLASKKGPLPRAGALVIAEPTSNYPLIGHKGSLWIRCRTAGVSAHGSMPEKGVNAIYTAARAIERLRTFKFGPSHPLLGPCTLNVGTIQGGQNTNSVPDTAEFTVDIRTVSKESNRDIFMRIQRFLGPEVVVETITDVQGIATSPSDPWVRDVFAIAGTVLGEKVRARTAPYFTDGAPLKPALGNPPTIIMGPGDPSQAHTTDEYCSMTRLCEAVDMYFEIGKKWLQ
jgi:succinyl-diaminopimelate desuccinylase